MRPIQSSNRLRIIALSISTLLLAPWSPARAQGPLSLEEPLPLAPSHTIFLDLSRHVLSIAGAEMPLIGANWEYRLSQSPIAILSGFRLGYLETDTKRWSYGLGLGVRRYLYEETSGAFLQCSFDVGESNEDQMARDRYGFASVEYGYKIVGNDFIVAIHAGPQFFGFANGKSTSLTLGIDLGFPLSARSFRHP